MSTRWIRILKPIVFLLGLVPVAVLAHQAQQGTLGADPVLSITHFTGSWALWILLGSLVISPVRKLIPKLSWIIRFRRMVGLFAFFYATLHLATYVLLFSGFDIAGAFTNLKAHDYHAIAEQWRAVWPTMVDDLQKRRFIQVGLLAWFLLFLLALTSPQWVMRKMGGKRWQTLHKVVYGAAALGVIHYIWVVKSGNLEWLLDGLALLVGLGIRVAWSLQKRFAQNKVASASSATRATSTGLKVS